MSRWEPDSRRRLQEAAVALYAERGFAETTVAALAEHVGLTERTFFRHFADKREVLFANEDALRDVLVAAVMASDAPTTRGRATAGLEAVVAELEPRRAELRRREAIIAAHPELREREATKLASWTTALDGALRDRGAGPREAQLAAAVGVALLDVAARRWLAGAGPDDLLTGLRATAEELITLR